MKILELRYYLATEIGLAVSIIGLVIALLTIFITVKKKTLVARICTVIVTALLVCLLFVNKSDMENYINVPVVKGMSVEMAEYTLISAGLEDEDIILLNYDTAILDSTAKIKNQIAPDDPIVPKGTQIILECKSNTYIGTYGENTVIIGSENSPSTDDLSIIIEDYELFTDGFYYEMPIDENSYSFVDFNKGISGHFSYSRELTEQEYKNWGHGGKILDANGNESDIDAMFFSTSDGVFAVQLPKYMPKGNYSYLLYQYINDKYYEARISFEVN